MTIRADDTTPDDRPEDGKAFRQGPPYDLMLICMAAVCMAVLIGVTAGLVWLRLFGTA
ncbi:MAG: hypothetical protein WDN45_17840 [Caulobacteraceae bacterium]